MIDLFAIVFLFIIAILCIGRIWKERAEERREDEEARRKLYQGGPL